MSIKPQPSYRGDFPGPSRTSQSLVSFGTEKHVQLRKDNHARLPDQYETHHGSDGRWNERNVRQQKGLPTIGATPLHAAKKQTGSLLRSRPVFTTETYRVIQGMLKYYILDLKFQVILREVSPKDIPMSPRLW